MPAQIIALEIDSLPQTGSEAAICELFCVGCGEGMRFDQPVCGVCGCPNVRFLSD